MSEEVSIAGYRRFLKRDGRERDDNHAGKTWTILRRELKKGGGGAKDDEVTFDPRDVRGLLDRNDLGPKRSKGKGDKRPNYVRNLGPLIHGDLDDFLKELGF